MQDFDYIVFAIKNFYLVCTLGPWEYQKLTQFSEMGLNSIFSQNAFELLRESQHIGGHTAVGFIEIYRNV